MNDAPEVSPAAEDPHATCAAQHAELEGKWRRTLADFVNQEREFAREREETAKFCTADLLRDLLPIGDALRAAGEQCGELCKLFDDFLARSGVVPTGAVGEPVDYLLHEVVGTRTEPGKKPGIMLGIVQVGYTMHGRLLRSAKVIISE